MITHTNRALPDLPLLTDQVCRKADSDGTHSAGPVTSQACRSSRTRLHDRENTARREIYKGTFQVKPSVTSLTPDSPVAQHKPKVGITRATRNDIYRMLVSDVTSECSIPEIHQSRFKIRRTRVQQIGQAHTTDLLPSTTSGTSQVSNIPTLLPRCHPDRNTKDANVGPAALLSVDPFRPCEISLSPNSTSPRTDISQRLSPSRSTSTSTLTSSDKLRGSTFTSLALTDGSS